MGSSTIPGPLGGNFLNFFDIDDGTLIRMMSPVPGPVGVAQTPTLTVPAAVSMELTWDQIKADMTEHEALIKHLYVDSVGKVTVGIGNMLPNLAAAQAQPFVVRGNPTQSASAAEVKTDWDAVSGHAGENLRATSFAKYTLLDLPEDICWALLKKRIDNEFLPGLKGLYDDWDKFPLAAKRALLDMAYNLGMAGFKKFKTLNGHVKKADWEKAAGSCSRQGIPADRNEWTRARFNEAVPPKVQP